DVGGVQRGCDRRQGERPVQREDDALGAAALREVVVRDRDAGTGHGVLMSRPAEVDVDHAADELLRFGMAMGATLGVGGAGGVLIVPSYDEMREHRYEQRPEP